MKRLIGIALAIAMVAAMLATGAVAVNDYTKDSADDSEAYKGTVTYANGKYTAAYSGTLTGYYAILVVKKAADGNRVINETTVMYIDQEAPTGNSITFDFIPRSTPDCEVLLGGDFGATNSPIVLGELKGQGIEVTGSVSYLGTTKPDVTLTSTTDSTVVQTATVADAVSGTSSYSFAAVPDGEYTLEITKSGNLTYTQAVTIDADNAALGCVKILSGDSNTDQYLNGDDITAILTYYMHKPSESVYSDGNEDGYINGDDLSIILTNYLQTSHLIGD